MTPFTIVQGPAVPLLIDNVDTDVVIRIDRLVDFPREELGPYTLESIRNGADGAPDPVCPLNKPEFHNAPILIATNNFGCGSSREGAVWALQALGVRCVIAVSFGDIFFSNCFQNGVLAIRLPESDVEALAEQAATARDFVVDLPRSIITTPDHVSHPFAVQHLLREGLIQGLDPIGLTLKRVGSIQLWESREAEVRPWNVLAARAR